MSRVEESCLMLELDENSDRDPVLVWEEVFGNSHSVEVEMGIGKGRFLIDAAQRHPEVNYLGIERAHKYLRIAHARSLKRHLTNIRFARTDAREFLEFCVPAESVRAIHLYFPDPWPKKRHHKRRLFDSVFLSEVERCLEPGGRLWLATDHEEYFERMLEVLAGSADLGQVEGEWTGPRTNYEDKYISQGKEIHRRVLEKSVPRPSANG